MPPPPEAAAPQREHDGGGAASDASAPEPLRDAAPVTMAQPVNIHARVAGLVGSGLKLRSVSGEELSVEGDGEVAFRQPVTALNRDSLLVVQQPINPSQTCSADVRSDGSIAVSCEVTRFAIGGTVSGLAGSGLVLQGSWGDTLELASDGAFSFPDGVRDLESYVVTVASSPQSPRQTCTIERAEGRVTGRDVVDLSVLCTTHRFGFSGTVSGMLGDGLVLELSDGETIAESVAVAVDGKFAFESTLLDASRYAVRVKKQPERPNQRCLVVDGEAQLRGADVSDLTVVCGALGGLRVSEVGSCHYANSACWFELYNAGSATEELSYYQVRTQSAGRVAPYQVNEAKLFTLPSAAVAPNTRVVVRARSTGSLGDGQGVLHIANGNELPWWSGDGFVELLTAGRTVDFVSFGGNGVAPTTPAAWRGESAPLLPAGGERYGYAIARDRSNSDSDRASDWTLRAFATPGGPNDVTSDVDSDEDGVPDSAEVDGSTFAGLDLYAMGARVGVRDLFVEIDYMDTSDPAVIPRREALEKVAKSFARHGIAVHFDVGNLYSARIDPAKFNLGGGNVVPFAKGVGFGPADGIADLYTYKAAHMAAVRRSFFFYSLFASSQNANGSGGSSGLGERPGNDTIISLGGWGLDASSTFRTNLLINYQAATLMHELGHNLGLRHGGSDDLNRKPNYVSVMNYLYSPLGLPTIGHKEGDRFDIFQHCSIFSVAALTNPPTGSPDAFVLDFSDGYSGDLLESSLLEADGLGRADSSDVDYNCNGKRDGPYERDLNDDGRKDLLTDHDDWSNIQVVFRRSFAGNENGPSLWRVAEPVREDVLTDDTQQIPSEPCPPPTL